MWLEQREKGQLLLFFPISYEQEDIQLAVILGKYLTLDYDLYLEFESFMFTNMSFSSSYSVQSTYSEYQRTHFV